MHIPDDPGYYEKYYFTPGDTGFRPIDTRLGRLGVLICWDQWFPEAARLSALAGAEILLYPTAIGWDPRDTGNEQRRQQEAWMVIQRAHAIANGLPLLACNRVGYEPDPSGQTGGIQFWGSSFVCGPQGEILAQAPEDRAALLCATLDLERTETLRRSWPFLRDRRIDAYDGLLRRYLDASGGLRRRG
jgi:N-carbamoylputrescine amidase